MHLATNVAIPAPTPVLSGLASTVGLGGDSVTIDFGQTVTGFELSDLTLSATLEASRTDGLYMFDMTAVSDGPGSISLPAGVADTSGVQNEAATAVMTSADVIGPEFTLVSVTADCCRNNIYVAQFEVTPAETGLSFGPTFSVSNVTNGSIVRGSRSATGTHTITFAVTGGPASSRLTAGILQDEVGNLSLTAGPFDLGTYDLTPPTITIAPFTGALNGPQTAEITLSEARADFLLEDLNLTNATATLTGSGTSFTAVLTPIADGTVALLVAAATFSDAAGNFNTLASDEVTSVFDGTEPSVSIVAFVGFPGDPIALNINFTEPVSGFEVGDITVTGTTITNFVNDCGSDPCAIFRATATATAASDFSYTVDIAADAAQDAAGNGNTLATQFTAGPLDGIAPVVSITGVPDGFIGPVTATITFDCG